MKTMITMNMDITIKATSYDPHVWLDPVLDQQFAKKIKDDLVHKDPTSYIL